MMKIIVEKQVGWESVIIAMGKMRSAFQMI